jgi:hypothetical protein
MHGYFSDSALSWGMPSPPPARPFTLDTQTYKVCLDCGKKIEYSLERMEPLRLKERRELKIAKS